MTIKEMEERSGLPRASIRYYEAEGLVHPRREKNGYRDYSEADLAVLEKIRLLRRLGVSLGDLTALQSGERTLAETLDGRMSALSGEQAALRQAAAVCEELRAREATFDTLEADPYLKMLDEGAAAPALPAADSLPTACNPVTRLAARIFDWWLVVLAILCVMSLTGHNPATVSSGAVGLLVLLAIFFMEPALLHVFATTPGKALLGLHLAAADGRKLTYTEGLRRMGSMAWHGLGLGVPIWNLVQLFRSADRCANGEAQPWDEEVAYTARPVRAARVAAFVLAAALTGFGGECVNSACQLPPNRGDLTVAEFAENFNRQADYCGLGLSQELDENGRWRDIPDETGSVRVHLTDADWPEAREFVYTVENGKLTAVTMTASRENVTDWVSLPTEQMAMTVAAFTWARKDTPFFTDGRQKLLDEMSEKTSEGYVLHQGGTVISLEVKTVGLEFFDSVGMLIPLEATGENSCSFTFRVVLEE